MFWPFETWEIIQDKVFTEHKNKIKSDFFSMDFFLKSHPLSKQRHNLGMKRFDLKANFITSQYNFIGQMTKKSKQSTIKSNS